MKKRLKGVSIVLLVVYVLSVVVVSPNLGSVGVDVVSAATSGSSTGTSQGTPNTTGGPTILQVGAYGNGVELIQTLLNNHGYALKVDGIFGPKTLAAVKDFQSKNGLAVDGKVGAKSYEKLNPEKPEVEKTEEPEVETPVVIETTEVTGTPILKLGRVDYAAHGTKSFANAVVAMAGDKIIGASIDEYQFLSGEGVKGVPNSDVDFGKNYADAATVLASKRVNTEFYSGNMKTKAGSTQPIHKNFAGIEAYATGKTVAELETELSANSHEQMVDAVSGATLKDTKGYLEAILEAAKDAKNNEGIQVEVTVLNNINLERVDYAAHGTKSFANAVVAMTGDKIIDASIDEYQFLSGEGVKGVPNSDADFGKNYADTATVLASKRVNTEFYSGNMKTKAGSTQPIHKNFAGIAAYAQEKTVAELEATLSTNSHEQMVDAVSGATLKDTKGYLLTILEGAKNASNVEEVDAVTSASIVNEEAAFLNAISEAGTWIIATLNDLTFDEELVLEGEFRNKGDATKDLYRKLAPYTQDADHNVTERFTITAPKMTIKSPNAKLQGGIFVGDIYVEVNGFVLKDAKVEGNVYFANEGVKSTFVMDEKSSVTGVTEVK